MAPDASEARRDASPMHPELRHASTTPQDGLDSPFVWTSPAGIALIRDILLKWPIPFDPHEYLLMWTAHVLQGAHFFGITATGDGKSCMFYFALIVILYFAKNGPSPCGRSWPKNPIAIVILPINAIEEELGPALEALGFKVVVINQHTLARGARMVWASVRGILVHLLVLSPELLASKAFEQLLNTDFASRVVYIVVDEAHLLLTWGAAFRKAFRQIGLLRARFLSRVQIIALSATVMPGREVFDICNSLGLRAADMQFDRRCNLRANLSLQRHSMLSALDGPEFPELRWMVAHRLKAIVFCRTIARVWRVCSYMWSSLPPGPDRELGVRPYHALNSAEYNTETRRLLLERDGGVFVATTSALSVGVDLPRIDTVAIWGTPEDVNSVVQEAGRAGRGQRHCIALGILYIPAATLTRAAAVVTSGKATSTMPVTLARLLATDDISPIIDDIYQNPPPAPCFCETCGGHAISGDPAHLRDGPALQALAAEKRRAAEQAGSVKQKKPRGPTTKAMRAQIVTRLCSWRDDVYFSLPYDTTMHMPPRGLIPDAELEGLAAQIFEITTERQVHEFLTTRGRTLLLPSSRDLHDLLESCRNDIAAEAEAKRVAKQAAKRAGPRDDTPEAESVRQTTAVQSRKKAPVPVAQAPSLATVSPESFYGLRSRGPLQDANTVLPVRSSQKRKATTTGQENSPGTGGRAPKKSRQPEPAVAKKATRKSSRQKK